mmetsp:Transcript_16125/g.44022  ORF Transcript_16125/g.44022 Transcript_16125/m.44022 type:complete len:239 (+) Transcript_16125:1371-2087(+)
MMPPPSSSSSIFTPLKLMWSSRPLLPIRCRTSQCLKELVSAAKGLPCRDDGMRPLCCCSNNLRGAALRCPSIGNTCAEASRISGQTPPNAVAEGCVGEPPSCFGPAAAAATVTPASWLPIAAADDAHPSAPCTAVPGACLLWVGLMEVRVRDSHTGPGLLLLWRCCCWGCIALELLLLRLWLLWVGLMEVRVRDSHRGPLVCSQIGLDPLSLRCCCCKKSCKKRGWGWGSCQRGGIQG